MGQQLADSDHPQLAAFRTAWQNLPHASLPEGPAAAVQPFTEVAELARSLAAKAETGKFKAEDIAALRAVVDASAHHAERLAATSTRAGGTRAADRTGPQHQPRASRRPAGRTPASAGSHARPGGLQSALAPHLGMNRGAAPVSQPGLTPALPECPYPPARAHQEGAEALQ
ncbi:hypothetical protein [Streptomyces sp. C36]|uniref:hypothetical protein n=1 Tax=Streptomyces sp. C36 TaxID=3237122 RepID=UPI0034C6612A